MRSPIMIGIAATFCGLALGTPAEAQTAGDDPLANNGTYIGPIFGAAFDAGTQNVTLPNGVSLPNGGSIYNRNSRTAPTIGILIGRRQYLSRRLHIFSGLEADISYVAPQYRDANGTVVVPSGSTLPAGSYSFSQKTGAGYVGSVRGHLGYALPRASIYFTSGFAFAGNTRLHGGTVTYVPVNGGTPISVTGDGSGKSTTGTIIGGGAEVSLSRQLVGRLEFLHYSLGGTKRSFALPVSGQSIAIDESAASGHFDTVRVGLLYTF